MKKFFSLFICLGMFTLSAKAIDEVNITALGDGETRQEAINNALRSALEQAYGTFMSSDSRVFNDELVKDEIVTITSGNIVSYSVLNETRIADNVSVLCKARVSLNRLLKFTESKGAVVAFSGNSFAANMKLEEMNKKAEAKAFEHLESLLKSTKGVCDYELLLRNPQINTETSSTLVDPMNPAGPRNTIETKNVVITGVIVLKANDQTVNYTQLLLSTLSEFNLPEEVEGNGYAEVGWKLYRFRNSAPQWLKSDLNTYRGNVWSSLRSEEENYDKDWRKKFKDCLFYKDAVSFTIYDNLHLNSELAIDEIEVNIAPQLFYYAKDLSYQPNYGNGAPRWEYPFWAKKGDVLGELNVVITIPAESIAKYSNFGVRYNPTLYEDEQKQKALEKERRIWKNKVETIRRYECYGGQFGRISQNLYKAIEADYISKQDYKTAYYLLRCFQALGVARSTKQYAEYLKYHTPNEQEVVIGFESVYDSYYNKNEGYWYIDEVFEDYATKRYGYDFAFKLYAEAAMNGFGLSAEAIISKGDYEGWGYLCAGWQCLFGYGVDVNPVDALKYFDLAEKNGCKVSYLTMLYMIAEGACSQIKSWKADEITTEIINDASGRYIEIKGIQKNVVDQHFQWVYTDYTPNVLPNYQQIAPSTRN